MIFVQTEYAKKVGVSVHFFRLVVFATYFRHGFDFCFSPYAVCEGDHSVTDVATAKRLAGCTNITGNLLIQIRSGKFPKQ